MCRQLAKELDTPRGVVGRVAKQLAMSEETVRYWWKKAEINDGHAPGVSSDASARISELERENAELQRSNAILKAAAAFFAAEFDRPQKN